MEGGKHTHLAAELSLVGRAWSWEEEEQWGEQEERVGSQGEGRRV